MDPNSHLIRWFWTAYQAFYLVNFVILYAPFTSLEVSIGLQEVDSNERDIWLRSTVDGCNLAFPRVWWSSNAPAPLAAYQAFYLVNFVILYVPFTSLEVSIGPQQVDSNERDI